MIAFLRFEILRTLRNARFLIMLLAFPKEKQRVSDRIAETIVVRA